MLFKNKQCEKCGNYYDVTFEECPLCHTQDGKFRQRNIPKNIAWLSPWQQILLALIGFAYGGMLFYELIFSSLFEKLESIDENLAFFLTASLTYVALLITLVAVLFPRIKEFLKHFKSSENYLYGIAYAFTVLAVSTIVGLISTYGLNAEINSNQDNVNNVLALYPIPSFFILGIIGPICEELTYRVGLYSFLRRLNKYVALIITTLVFAFIHFDIESFSNIDMFLNELKSFPIYIAAGLTLTIAYEHKGPACSIIAHVLYNTLTVVILMVS